MALLINSLENLKTRWRKAYAGVTNDTAPADNLLNTTDPYVIGFSRNDGVARRVLLAIDGLAFGGTAQLAVYVVNPLIPGPVLSLPSVTIDILATDTARVFNFDKGEQVLIIRVVSASAPIDVYISTEQGQ